MFSAFGSFAYKFRYFILAGWLIITALLVLTASSLSKVCVTDQSQFLFSTGIISSGAGSLDGAMELVAVRAFP
jgi:uncharacterized membrane protein YdfJ with MMPL/SSD domain